MQNQDFGCSLWIYSLSKIWTIFINMESLRTLHCKVVTCRMDIKRIVAIHIFYKMKFDLNEPPGHCDLK